LILSSEQALELWKALLSAGVAPIGLGARDTLRLEAGMNLYGSDMGEQINPYQSGMAWTLALQDEDRDFVGKEALLELREKNDKVLVGLVLKERGVLRAHQRVVVPEGEGEITSGTFSPSLEHSIALARIPKTEAAKAQVEIRKKTLEVDIVKVPFVRHGKAVYKTK
jgi:aminomethyltransferase